MGIVGQLPAFQGNVPVQLKALAKDSNITKAGDTGWMDSLDPLYGKIADEWMKVLIEDFGTDHWYQLDGYFNGATAPWYDEAAADSTNSLVVAADSSIVSSVAMEGKEAMAAAAAVEGGKSVYGKTYPPTPPGADLMAFRRGLEAYQVNRFIQAVTKMFYSSRSRRVRRVEAYLW